MLCGDVFGIVVGAGGGYEAMGCCEASARYSTSKKLGISPAAVDNAETADEIPLVIKIMS